MCEIRVQKCFIVLIYNLRVNSKCPKWCICAYQCCNNMHYKCLHFQNESDVRLVCEQEQKTDDCVRIFYRTSFCTYTVSMPILYVFVYRIIDYTLQYYKKWQTKRQMVYNYACQHDDLCTCQNSAKIHIHMYNVYIYVYMTTITSYRVQTVTYYPKPKYMKIMMFLWIPCFYKRRKKNSTYFGALVMVRYHS